MTVLPQWLTQGDSDFESDLSNIDDSFESDGVDSSDEEIISRRFRRDGVYNQLPAAAQRLPAAIRIPEIQEAVNRNRVVCVLGNTGCGKSTIVPYVLGSDEGVKVLCTQPRRMAAISLCEHVQKSFYGQRNHPSVGYRVRGQRTDGEESKIIYVTAGYLKTMLTHEPSELDKFTHIILDEVHERGIDSDFLSLIVKRLLAQPENERIKLVVMSATLESELFVDYFAALNNGQTPATVKLTVPQKGKNKSGHRIDEYFMDDMQDIGYADTAFRFFQQQVVPRADVTQGVICGELSDSVQNLIIEILRLHSRDRHSSLVFLPGLGEIFSVNDKLTDALYRAGQTVINPEVLLEPTASASLPTRESYYHIFILHSTMPYEEQKLALKEPAHNARHIVLCTNVAESSLTVPNVDVVIDTGLRKANSYDAKMGVFRLTTVWCSRASCLQRRGRTGRVCDGKYFKLFSKEFYETKMLLYDTPEVLLTDLSSVFLNAKYISEFWRQPGGANQIVRPSDILKELITPPRVKSVKAAVQDLFESGLLRHEPDEMSELSLLGTLATRLHVEPQVARILYFGWLSGLVCEGIILAAACGMDADVIRSTSARSYPGKEDYCKNLYNFMWYRTDYDLGAFSEPIAVRNLLWAWLASYYNVKQSGAPEYYKTAVYAKEFDSFKRSVLNHCAQFISWMEEEICDEHARDEAETLRDLLSERWRRTTNVQEAISHTVFKCGRNSEKLKAMLVLSMNTRLLTADVLTKNFDEHHAVVLEKLPESLFAGCYTDEERDDRVSEVVTRLCGRSAQGVLQVDRASWAFKPGKDYTAAEAIQAPASDFQTVKDDYHLLPNQECEYYGAVMPIAVRMCMQIFDRRYNCNLEFTVGGEAAPLAVKAKIRSPVYSNGLKWGRISRKRDELDITTWLPVSINARSPVGWLHKVDPSTKLTNRLWGVAGKIVGTTKSMFEDQNPLEARAINVTILPAARGGRVAVGLLLMALPFHSGLVADVDISPQGQYEIVRLKLESRFFDINLWGESPLTGKMLKAVSEVRRLIARAIDIPGSCIRQTDGSAAATLSVAPEVMQRVRDIQFGCAEDKSLSTTIDSMLHALYTDTETSDSLFPTDQCDPKRRVVMLIPDSGSSYTEIITDPTLWVPPSMGEQCLFAKRMLFRKDQIAEVQQRMMQPNYMLPRLVNQRDQQEAPVVRLSEMGFSVDEIHIFMERQPRFALAGMPLDTILDPEIDEESLIAAIGPWVETSRITEESAIEEPETIDPPVGNVNHEEAYFYDEPEMVDAPKPLPPTRLPPRAPVKYDAEQSQDYFIPEHVKMLYSDGPVSNKQSVSSIRATIARVDSETARVEDHVGSLSDIWSEIHDEIRRPLADPDSSAHDRLANIWDKLTRVSVTHFR